jgi:hypothetical protein
MNISKAVRLREERPDLPYSCACQDCVANRDKCTVCCHLCGNDYDKYYSYFIHEDYDD